MITIYDQEQQDDIADLILATACISYASEAQPCSIISSKNSPKLKSLASYSDSDLYYVQSILVSSSWNKNDDIFDKEEIWKAKNTPEDKPTNLEHNENLIIGHITSNWPITEDGILIDIDTPIDNLPEKYHILTGSVIYKGFSNPELRERSEKLISEIENGTKFVSMECFFNGFDYGLIHNETGEFTVLPRNNETAYLTKHLRAYGGKGYHDSYKIGRVLRNITFSGKGFVDKPANPDSIIFSKDTVDKILTEKNTILSKAGVIKNTSTYNAENNIMSLDLDTIQKDMTELKQKVEALKDCGCAEATKEAYAAALNLKDKTVELENTIKAQESQMSDYKNTIDSLLSEKEEAAKKMRAEKEAEELEKEEAAKKMRAEKEEEEKALKKLMADLELANEAISVYKMKEEEMLKKEKKMKRMARLVDSGIDLESAEAALDKFELLDDDSFEAFAQLLSVAAKKSTEPAETTDADSKELATEDVASKNVETTDASILEEVEVEDEISLSVGGEESPIDSTRAELVEFVCARLGKKLNKGE